MFLVRLLLEYRRARVSTLRHGSNECDSLFRLHILNHALQAMAHLCGPPDRRRETPMPDSSNFYTLTYGHFDHPALAEIRQETFGEDIGQNSWLTADEYRQFIGWLNLTPCFSCLRYRQWVGRSSALSGGHSRLPGNRLRNQSEQYGCSQRVGTIAWTWLTRSFSPRRCQSSTPI